jgi:hypothetical protein
MSWRARGRASMSTKGPARDQFPGAQGGAGVPSSPIAEETKARHWRQRQGRARHHQVGAHLVGALGGVAREVRGPTGLPQRGRWRVGQLSGRRPPVREGGRRHRHRQ